MAALLPALLVVVASGCATKGWVREELSRQQAEMGQRIGQVDERVGAEAQRVEKRVEVVEERVNAEAQKAQGTGTRIDQLESTIASTSETVRATRERADAAMAKAEGVDSRLTRLWNNRYNTKTVDTINVQFGFDRSDLDDGAQTTLLGLARELQSNPNLTVELVGYTDMRGNREYNYTLSQRRVDAVRRFLVEKGIQVGRIQAVGLGALNDPATPEAQKRRVSAKLMIDQN
jgi:outer membrane protein OmpA-like peptidoglycan-associated protein